MRYDIISRMKRLKRTMLMLIVVTLTMNNVVGSAMAACLCVHTASAIIEDNSSSELMPCHGNNKSEGQVNDMMASEAVMQEVERVESKLSEKCSQCDCGHCKVPSVFSISDLSLIAERMVMNVEHAIAADALLPYIPYIIENPPKLYS